MNRLHLIRSAWLAAYFFFLPLFSIAQIDTTLTIPAIEITAARINKKSHASYLQTIDSQTLAFHAGGNLSDLLTTDGGVFLKTYGLGSLATSALRGAGAGHTTVLWNGFNVQNPMNGVPDFSLYPVSLSDEISIQHGGGSSLHGSGSIGGAVLLENNLFLNKGLTGSAGCRAGSFGAYSPFGNIAFSNSRFSSDINIVHQQAENDFPISGSKVKQANAAFRQSAFSQNNLLKINEKQSLKSFVWWQQTGRDIPPSRTESNSHARQEDDVARVGLEWERIADKQVTKARAAYLEESILFFSDLTDSSRSRSKTWVAEAEQAFFMKKNQILRFGLHATNQSAATKETGPRDRQRIALFTSWQRSFYDEKLTWSLDARQELADGELIPFVASSGASFQWNKQLALHGRISKNYNLPTFNDLYWKEAFAKGNPSLQPETAWGGEFGFHFSKKANNNTLSADLTAFSNLVQNWILWSPIAGIWQPQNKRKVWARGLEAAIRGNRNTGHWYFSAQANGALTRSTVEEIYESDDENLLGKQLIYTPLFNGSASMTAFYKKTFLSYRHRLTGKRFTTTDNRETDALPAFHLASLSIGHSFFIKTVATHWQLTVDNLWNRDYEVIAARPMPGRSIQVQVRVEFGLPRPSPNDGRD